MGLLLLVVDRE